MLYNVALASMVQLYVFVVVQSLNHVQLFSTPWTEACHAFLSFTISWSLLKLMPTDSVMPSNHSSSITPFSSCPQSVPAPGSFPMSLFFISRGQTIGTSGSASVLPMNIQDWFPLGWTGWISLQSKGFWRVFSSTTIWKHQFFHAQPSLWSNSHNPYMTARKNTGLIIGTFVSKAMSLLFNKLSLS